MYRFTRVAAVTVALIFSGTGSANAASTARYCVANDSGYRLQLGVEYDETSSGTDVIRVGTVYAHRRFGVWGGSDWADMQYITIRRNGSNYKTISKNPSSIESIPTNTPRLTGSISISVTAVGDDAVANNCVLEIP